MRKHQLQVDEIFDAALRRAPGTERARYLGEACGGDADLKRRVERLLQASAEAGSFLESPAQDPSPTLNQAAAERPGTQIGPYKLRQQIGAGGFGVVYMAEQTEPVRRKVALKIIKPGMDTKEVIARFEAERQALALMDHRNVARVLDAGTTASSRPYFVMELVYGVPLTEFCDAQKLPPRERLRLFVGVCQAVQHAHQKGIIHRDLKPSNILITMDGDRPMPKVIDFGVSKALNQQLTEKTLFTAYGQMIGTPLYMSPEQARLSAHDVDTRSDVYSLGVLLYELLTGTTPFDSETLQTSSFDEMRRIIREVDPPRPSARVSTLRAEMRSTISDRRRIDPRKLGQSLRGELDWIVMKALEKDRERRYESASALAADVERYLNDESVEACPPSRAYRLRKFVRRNRGPVAAVSLVFLALLAGIIGTSWGLVRAEKAHRDALAAQLAEAQRAEGERRARDAETSERRRAEENARLAVSAVDEIMTSARKRLALYAPDQPMLAPMKPDGEKLERDLLEKGLTFYEQLARANGMDWAARRQRANAYVSAGGIHLRLGNLAESEQAFRQGANLLEDLAQERPDEFDNRYDLADACFWLFRPYWNTGRLQPAEEVIRRALTLFETLDAESPEQRSIAGQGRAFCQGWLTILLRRTGRPHEAEQADQAAIAWWENQVADHPMADNVLVELSFRYAALAEDLFQQGKQTELVQLAERMAERAAAIPNVPELRRAAAHCQLHMGQVREKCGQTDKAVSAYGLAVDAFGKLAADHPGESSYLLVQGDVLRQLALLLENAGRVAEAEAAHRQTVAILDKLTLEWPKAQQYRGTLASTLQGVGEFLSRAGRPAEAEEFQRRALGIFAQLAKDYPAERSYRDGYANSHLRLGWVLQSEGRRAEAEFTYRQAVPLYEKLVLDYPRELWRHHELAYAYWRLGALLRNAGRAQEAESLCRQAVASEEKLSDEFSNHAAYRERFRTFVSELAEDLMQQGRHDEAAKFAEKIAAALPQEPGARQTAAALLERCASLAGQDPRLSETDRKAVAQAYRDLSRELQQEAAKASSKEPEPSGQTPNE